MKANRWYVAVAVLALAIPVGTTAQAAPMLAASGMTKNDARLVEVQWRHDRHHGWHRHHWRDGYRRYSRGWGPALGGFVAGAAIGSAVANSRAQAAENNAYCSQRYKSYDPSSGTYMGYDGIRHPCP
ncbi:BA14K family protein [Bradyrhizobium sp. WSM471]|uniref:BA14K family protein n=1 Tax=Bradyrhizobium sp. WSM471 TaxID=319017 RepID=UPI00024D20B6|nr:MULTISPECIES: BA14K family protein [Bradyrhizobium]EHR01800.1 BA14K-like protein [Bradyrhizobium sp. WSM471]UFW43835.1 BA14K family protein [Bradyrhizobium canariense]